jgi:hypothetical protein
MSILYLSVLQRSLFAYDVVLYFAFNEIPDDKYKY